MRRVTSLLSVALLLTFSVTSALAHDYEPMYSSSPSGEAMVVDAALARPLGLIATALGAVTWVISLPFSLPSGSAGEAAQRLVVDPARYTFKRPLGEFHDRDRYQSHQAYRGGE